MRTEFPACAVLVLLAASGCASPPLDPDKACADWDISERVRTTDHCLALRTFESSDRGPDATLVVVLHGDAPAKPPNDQYQVAQRIAERNANVVAVGMLRPGYEDGQGGRSSGVRGRATGDNYTAEVADAVADALRLLAQHHATERVVVVGHSGGGAITALVASRHHGLMDQAVLVGCPCDLTRWREHMYELQSARVWKEPVESLSPLELAASFDPEASVIVAVGSEDSIAPPYLSESYVEALQANGKTVELLVLPGEGHANFSDPGVAAVVDRALRRLP